MASFKKINTEDIHAIGSVMNYCIAHHTENLSLDVLEKKLHINKYYISHIMNQKLNMGFNDYVISIRVSNACKYLTRTDKSITKISDLVGFNTLRTFNRAFAKQLGMTPSQYRAGK
jgi:YesN/AraC family two-component response regulator